MFQELDFLYMNLSLELTQSTVVLKQEVDSPGVEFSSLHISSPRPLRKKSSSDESFTGGGSGEEDDASESDESDIVTAPHVKQSSKGT